MLPLRPLASALAIEPQLPVDANPVVLVDVFTPEGLLAGDWGWKRDYC
jgi:hypothetical protein